MIFQDNIAKKYLQIHSRKYGILNNFYFYCKESFIYNKLGFILSLFLVPAGIIKSVASIFIPKLVIDSLESFRSEYTFLINIIIVTVVIAVSSIVELLAKNTMEHNMNSFVLIQLNKLWIEKVSTMDYEVFTSELGKQSASKARMTIEGTTRWGIGTYIPRLLELLTSFIGFIIYGCDAHICSSSCPCCSYHSICSKYGCDSLCREEKTDAEGRCCKSRTKNELFCL